MLFNSIAYLLFLPTVVLAYWRVPVGWRAPLLLAASYIFYGWWDYRFLSLIALSTVVDFTIGLRLHATEDATARKRLLATSIVVNLGVLGLFKYAGFFVDSFEELLRTAGYEGDTRTLNILLPVGLSFYSFQTISYSFDVYRRRIEPTRSLVTFATYVAFFPQLVAGPIERAQHLLPQISNLAVRRRPGVDHFIDGVALIMWGLVKKVVIADGVATIADDAFGAADSAHAVRLVAGAVAFSIQIYGDFSGYTDMARGSARLLGVDLVVNFRQPYQSRNITEFWRRWHISLSDWLRDYLYIPLGGNRGGNWATYRNLMVTMLLGGLWHGAGWNFVVWGGLHGGALAVHRWFRQGHVSDRPVRWSSPSELLSVVTTFGLVVVAFVFFRADSLGRGVDFLRGIVTLRGIPDAVGTPQVATFFTVALWLGLVVVMDLIEQRAMVPHALLRARPALAGVGLGAFVVVLAIFGSQAAQPFIYFQF